MNVAAGRTDVHADRRSRRWCFTINNYDDADLARLAAFDLSRKPNIRYLVYGRELGSANQTPHLQGFIIYDKHQRFGTVKRDLGGNKVHLEIALGSDAEASEYCKKEGDFTELGELRDGRGRQGHRSDLSDVKDVLDQGGTLADVASNHFGTFVRYSRGIALAASLLDQPRDWKTQVVYLYGPTGSGKTRRAKLEADALSGGKLSWVHDPTLRWFDGYSSGSKAVIIDDFAGGVAIPFLLRLFDRYPMKVQVKGGWVEWRPRLCYVTSNYSLDHWYNDDTEHYRALIRRVEEITKIE